jgi:hypothetical protein
VSAWILDAYRHIHHVHYGEDRSHTQLAQARLIPSWVFESEPKFGSEQTEFNSSVEVEFDTASSRRSNFDQFGCTSWGTPPAGKTLDAAVARGRAASSVFNARMFKFRSGLRE